MALNLDVTITPLAFEDEVLGAIDLPKSQLTVTRGLGSGLTRRSGDPAGTIWAVGDRGPNLKVPLAIARYGMDELAHLADIDGAKVMPMLDVGPAISELRVEQNRVICVRTIALRDGNGTPLSGLPIPGGVSEPAFDLEGRQLPANAGGADTEGIAAVSDGTFWVADEYGPSLFHVAADGGVLARWVPEGCAGWFDGARYPILEALPAIAARRQINRGFEALALSTDEASLYLAFQSPLAHPDEPTHRHARHIRIWQLDLANRSVAAQYLYPLDSPDTFARDAAVEPMHWRDLKVSELVMLGDGRLLVLERGSATTKLYFVEPGAANVVDRAHLDVATVPTLEQLSAQDRLDPTISLAKTLLLSTDDHPGVGADLEGLTQIAPGVFVIVNDNDFGIEGVATRCWRIDVPGLEKDIVE